MISKSKMPDGFTLVELLVVVAVLSIMGVLLLTIFTSSLRGSNKSQILSSIKQNGQAVLENMDKTIRSADRVVCVSSEDKTVVVVNKGNYTRYRFIKPTAAANGYMQQENFALPSSPPQGADPNLYIRDFESTVCIDPSISPQIITDTNPQTGISIDCVGNPPDCPAKPIFKRDKLAGYKDQVTIQFSASPAVNAPAALRGQIDAVTFETTVQVR